MKQSGERLEDVTIKSVTDTEIVYILNGAETTLQKSEVAILYDDGRYEEIKILTSVSTAEPVVFKDYDIEAMRTYTLEQKAREAEARKLAIEQKQREAAEKKQAQEAAKLEALEKARIKAEEARLAQEREYQDGLIHKISSNQYYFVDNYYSKKDIQSLIVTQCPNAQQYYDKAQKWIVGGWSGAGASVALIITGSILIAVDHQSWYENGTYYYYAGGAWAAGVAIMCAGLGGVVASTTIACIGHARKNKTYEVYNSSCAAKNESLLSFDFGATRNGIGLTMHF